MLQIFRGKVCNVADLPGGGKVCNVADLPGGKVCKGEGLQYNTGSGENNNDPDRESLEKPDRLIVISNVFDILFISYARFFLATSYGTRKYTLYFIIIGIFCKIVQPRNFSVTRTENRVMPCIRNFGLLRTLSINNYIRPTLSIRNGHIQKELGLIAHVLL